MIVTANTFFNKSFEVYRRTVIMPLMNKMGLQDPGTTLLVGDPLTAIVNHGKWLVRCDQCNGAEKMWEEGIFMCLSCFNAAHGHHYRPAVFPRSRKRIEKLLSVRRIPNRNWELVDKLVDLEDDNKLHKDELLEVRHGS